MKYSPVLLAGFLLLLGARAYAEEPIGDTPEPSDITNQTWSLRGSFELGATYFTYEETLRSAAVDTDYETLGFGVGFWVEANLHGLSPYMTLRSTLTYDDERAQSLSGSQNNDLDVSTLLLDVGLGYRLGLSTAVTLVPQIAYTLDLFGFQRSNFELNGTSVILTDLDGSPTDEVGESFLGHGITGVLALELEPSDSLVLLFRAAYTHLPHVDVENDIGGNVSSEGYLIRGSATLQFWLQPNLGISFGIEGFFQVLDQSNPKLRVGTASAAIVQFPDSDAAWGNALVGVVGRF